MGESTHSPRMVRFGVYEVDLRAGELRKSGVKIKLQEQPFQILALLLERPGEVVTREEIQKKLWPADTFVDFEHSLNAAVKRLREALGDSADNPRFVETLPRRGYRFIYPVEGRDRASHTWQVALVLAALGVLLAGAASFFYFQRAQALTESDYILLTDFVNKTSDEVFDGTLKQALAVKLEESPFLNIFPERKARETLRLMEREPDERVTESIGREICERQGIKAMLLGEIAPLGTHYVISLNAVNCATGDSLAREQVEAEGKEEVLKALGSAASKVRGKLGESLASIEQFDTPIEQATTSSLEALKAYNLGHELREKGDENASIPFFERAIELDPNFASAYARLGTVYGNRGEAEKSIEYTKKAYGLRDRVSEPERLYITAHYYGTVTGEIHKEAETYEVWLMTYPRTAVPLNNLTLHYNNIGQYEKALEIGRRSLEVAPDSVYPYMNLSGAYLGLNRLEEDKAILQQGLDRGFDIWVIHAG
ncbi:MAG: winged helix-turn-helix domain-containing protein, partial [Candidatus Acidiferrales bacterium]